MSTPTETLEGVSGLPEAAAKAIIKWARDQSGQIAIWDKPNQPRPEPPYISVNNITGPVKVGGKDALEVIDNQTYRLTGQRSFTLSVNAYGDLAKKTLIDMRDSFDDPSVIEDFSQAGLGVWIEGSPTDVGALLETGFEGREQMDVVFGIMACRDVKAPLGGTIGTVELEGNVNGDIFKTTVTEP